MSSKPQQSSGNNGVSAVECARQEKQRQLMRLLDSLDAREANDEGRLSRRSVRAPFRQHGVRIVLHHPGGSTAERRVLTRDLSAGGLSFIHNGYLHVRTRCGIILRRHGGGEDTVLGQVTNCSHVAGTWHTVGVKFDEKISPKLYLDPEQAGNLDLEARRPQDLFGRVLLLDANDLDRRLMGHYLRQSRIDLVSVTTLVEALHELAAQKEKGEFDLVLTDLRLEGEDAGVVPADLIRRLMAAGADNLAICSAETNLETLGPVHSLGVAGMLKKPFEADRLLATLAGWLGVTADSDLIYSTLARQMDMRPLLTEFVTKVHALGDDLKQSCEDGNHDRCRAICLTLNSSGGGYGFKLVTDSAAEALRLLEVTRSVQESLGALLRLQEVCRRVTDASPDGDPGEELAAA